jgi:hypothetical protein
MAAPCPPPVVTLSWFQRLIRWLRGPLAHPPSVRMLPENKRVRGPDDGNVVEAYQDAGAEFGDAVSHIYMGECLGFEALLSAWEKAEADYAAAGYRTLAVDDFVSIGGWGKEMPPAVLRADGEPAVRHAPYYRQQFLGQVAQKNPVDEAFRTGKPVRGTYLVPSTKHLKFTP